MAFYVDEHCHTNQATLMSARIALLATLLIFPLVASAELFKWVDDQGNVHYGDKPPINKNVETIAPAARADEKEAKRLRERTQKILSQQQQRAQAQARKRAVNKKTPPSASSLKRRCNEAKSELAFYKKPGKHMIVDENGDLVRIKGEERKKRKQELRDIIEELCE
jgi:hypothetical protein